MIERESGDQSDREACREDALIVLESIWLAEPKWDEAEAALARIENRAAQVESEYANDIVRARQKFNELRAEAANGLKAASDAKFNDYVKQIRDFLLGS